jgi:TRAP-type C4-dicarboxylate transport system permease small subunit
VSLLRGLGAAQAILSSRLVPQPYEEFIRGWGNLALLFSVCLVVFRELENFAFNFRLDLAQE